MRSDCLRGILWWLAARIGGRSFRVGFAITGVCKMKRIALLLLAVAFGVLNDSNAEAQVGYVNYYQPVTVYRPAPVYYSSYYAAPAPVVYAAPAPVYQPVTRVRTRYRPILGGTVTRVRHGYAPAYYSY